MDLAENDEALSDQRIHEGCVVRGPGCSRIGFPATQSGPAPWTTMK